MIDASDVVLEADVVAVRQRLHERIPGLPVRVFTLTVATALKGETPATVELVLAGGDVEDGSVGIAGQPSLTVGDHVVVFLRQRALIDVALAEPLGLRLTSNSSIYRRALSGELFISTDGWDGPLGIDDIDGGTPTEATKVDPLEDEAPPVVLDPVPTEWFSLIAVLTAEAAVASPSARPPASLVEVTP